MLRLKIIGLFGTKYIVTEVFIIRRTSQRQLRLKTGVSLRDTTQTHPIGAYFYIL